MPVVRRADLNDASLVARLVDSLLVELSGSSSRYPLAALVARRASHGMRAAHEALAAGIHEAGVMLPPHSTRPTSTASSSRWSDLLARHRQPADIGNGFDRAVWPDPKGHDDGEQQQTAETANGSVQLPVRSRIQAKATGERMPATAPEAFISELEVPA